MEDKKALAAEFGIDIESLDFSMDDYTLDELREKFEAMKSDETQVEPTADEKFELEGQFCESLVEALQAETVETCFGDMPRYWFVDYDKEASEVYCTDSTDWRLYGFSYSMNGDNVVIDFECKKRKKFSIVDFDEGEQTNPMANIFAMATDKYNANNSEWSEKYQTASDTISSMNSELDVLRQYKADAECAIERSKRDEVFAQFEDLVGVEAFENLRENCMDYSAEELEEKCYAVRGRNGTVAKFSVEQKAPKLPVEKGEPADLPYGGVFAEYGIQLNNQNK